MQSKLWHPLDTYIPDKKKSDVTQANPTESEQHV